MTPDLPFSSATFRSVMGSFATGVTIVAGMDNDEPVGFTCQSFVSISLDPPFIAVAPARTSTTWPRIASSGRFCVNVLAEEQRELCMGFAVSGGKKFDGVAWEPTTVTGSPRLDGALAWVDCEVELVHDAGDHELILGRVVDLGAAESGRPLLYFRSGFATVAPGDEPTGAGASTNKGVGHA